MIYQLNGRMYLINQDIFQQDADTGALDIAIVIGMHDKDKETDQEYTTTEELEDGSTRQVQRMKRVAPRDWLQLRFKLAGKDDSTGAWVADDGFSDYSKVDHDLTSTAPSGVDLQQDVNLLEDQTTIQIGNSRVTT